jgi:hypothetical protein
VDGRHKAGHGGGGTSINRRHYKRQLYLAKIENLRYSYSHYRNHEAPPDMARLRLFEVSKTTTQARGCKAGEFFYFNRS